VLHFGDSCVYINVNIKRVLFERGYAMLWIGKENAEEQANAHATQLLLDMAQQEYGQEHERISTIDYKAGIALPILAAYFLAYAQMNNFKKILSLPITNFITSLIPVLLFVTYTAGLVLSMLSVFFMAKVVFAKTYHRINPIDLYKDENLTQGNKDFPYKVMQLYFEAIAYNRKANNERVTLYQRSWILTFISVICFVIYIITKNNI